MAFVVLLPVRIALLVGLGVIWVVRRILVASLLKVT